MALADYFRRSAVATAQVLQGFDEDAIRRRLENTRVGLSLPSNPTREGHVLAELSVRQLARLYPQLVFEGNVDPRLRDLARAINPEIELTHDTADLTIAIGDAGPAGQAIYAGSNGWDALISTTTPQTCGGSTNPFGAAAAACLACANLFRLTFLDDGATSLDTDLVLSTLELERQPTTSNDWPHSISLGDRNVLVGLGAIGNSAAFVLSLLEGASGGLAIVDHQSVDLGNLQRYVLAARSDEHATKVNVVDREFRGRRSPITLHAFEMTWAEYASRHGYTWSRALVALDSARDRRAVQASLPRWIANAWTQPGDLGISVHEWGKGACLNCLYLPTGETASEDKLIAAALGLGEDRELQIRQLLQGNSPPPREFLTEVSEKLALPAETLEPFAEKPLRSLYSEGICGGAVLPLDRLGSPDQHVHVPLAHQSALAGVLLAAQFVRHAIGLLPPSTHVSRINVLDAVPEHVTQLALQDPRGLCICQDLIYQEAYELKYGDLLVDR